VVFERGNTAAFAFFDQAEINRKDKDALEVKLREDLDSIEAEIL
jgi:hypothetical protein